MVAAHRESLARDLRRHPAVIAMLHAPALPGSSRSRLELDAIAARVIADARAAAAGGADALLIENYGDAPFRPARVAPHVVSMLTALAIGVRESVSLPLGVNVLRNDARAAIAVARAAGGSFVRINVLAGVVATDQGLVTGEAERVLAYRARLGARELALLADVDVKHGRPLWGVTIVDRARDLVERAGADALVVTGEATGRMPAAADVEAVRRACPEVPLLVGSGVDPDSARELLCFADGAIVGTALKRGGDLGAPIERARVEAVVRAARAAWAERKRVRARTTAVTSPRGRRKR